MKTELNFDNFVSVMHNLFDKLPDYRKTAPILNIVLKMPHLEHFQCFLANHLRFYRGSRRCRNAMGITMPNSFWNKENSFR